MKFEDIRKTAIIAMFSDDSLMETLVLKGGNALNLVLGISPRVSVDLDFSLENDFIDKREAAEKIKNALEDRFDSEGITVFDYKFRSRPQFRNKQKRWGGYEVTFKVMPSSSFLAIDSIDKRRREALVVAPKQQKTFKIHISTYEYYAEKIEDILDGYTIYVYPPVAIVIEKLRALCQQLPGYDLIPEKMKRPRPRDYYDIFTVIEAKQLDLTTTEHIISLKAVFQAKKVPTDFLHKLDTYRGFHSVGFEAVADAVQEPVQPFEFYADYLRDLVDKIITCL